MPNVFSILPSGPIKDDAHDPLAVPVLFSPDTIGLRHLHFTDAAGLSGEMPATAAFFLREAAEAKTHEMRGMQLPMSEEIVRFD